MTLIELIFIVFCIFVLYYFLRPLQQIIERAILRFLGVRGPRVIDVAVLRDKNKNDKE